VDALWFIVDGFAEAEEDQKTVLLKDPETGQDTGNGYVVVTRREVFVTTYERHSCQPAFAFGPNVSEVTLFGDPDSERVVKHGFRKSFITGKVVEFKEVHKPGKWKKIGTYPIAIVQPPA